MDILIDGENDGAVAKAQVAGESAASGDQAAQGVTVTAESQGASTANGDDAGALERDHKIYEAVLAEHDARIAELEGEIAEAARTAEGRRGAARR